MCLYTHTPPRHMLRHRHTHAYTLAWHLHARTNTRTHRHRCTHRPGTHMQVHTHAHAPRCGTQLVAMESPEQPQVPVMCAASVGARGPCSCPALPLRPGLNIPLGDAAHRRRCRLHQLTVHWLPRAPGDRLGLLTSRWPSQALPSAPPVPGPSPSLGWHRLAADVFICPQRGRARRHGGNWYIL